MIDAELASWRRVFGIGEITAWRIGMTAFPESGRSDHQILSEIKVRFRPKADVAELNPGGSGGYKQPNKNCIRSVRDGWIVTLKSPWVVVTCSMVVG